MVAAWVVVVVSLAYLGLLFGIAHYGTQRAAAGRSLISSGVVYALSLAVYATSWTYYGSVGRAATRGLEFLTIYLGPALMMACSAVVLQKIIRVSKRYHITSLSDFAAARYGNSRVLGGLVALIAVVGTVPYIALQLKAVSSTFRIVTGGEVSTADVPLLADTALYVALVLAVFAILFGTRHLDATERHEGMVAAIAFESVVKLVAFLAAGVFVTFGLFGGFVDLFDRAAAAQVLADVVNIGGYGNWFWLMVLSSFAVLLLPRQFQIGVVENVDERHVRTAAWLVPLYLLVINIFVVPIALAGLLVLGGTASPDTYVLALQQHGALALLVFVGGLSAATGMVIVETIALSTMVSNSLVVPLLLRRAGLVARRDLGRLVLLIRRITILVVLLLGFAFFRISGDALGLVDMGLVSFAAVAQFAPALLGGLWWKGGTRNGALVGLVAGIALWAYTLLLPELSKSGWVPESIVRDGPFGVALLRPQELFGLTGMGAVGGGVFWSLLVNVGLFVGVSLAGRPSPAEAGHAALFVDIDRQPPGPGTRFYRGSVPVAQLRDLLARFVGAGAATALVAEHAARAGATLADDAQADADLVRQVETALTGAVGPAAARALVASVVDEEPLGMTEVIELVGEAQHLRELDRLKDEFIATVTHELRTPLTSVRAFTEILRDNPGLPTAERARYLEIMATEAERLTRMVNQVLDLARLESGNARWRLTELDLSEVIDEAATATAQLFTDKRVALEVEKADPGPVVEADRDGVMQVLLNLLSNAVKVSPPSGGRVRIRLGTDDSAARIDVSDNGPGVPAADREVIFDRFRQGRPGARPSGTGLGLAISRRIVEQFGGTIAVSDCGGNGRGATFSVRLPVRRPVRRRRVQPSRTR
ncbi:ATP-binding protein [Pseudonocardia aurantiaca]|uniref:histidine kinase n=1 Tax=Pseudonocardia aurantiaca TaxID=75290 RepID=A0ABW4FNF1_9PSEU